MVIDMTEKTVDRIRPYGPVKRIGDPQEVDRLVAIASRIADGTEMIYPLVLRMLDWAAVPVIDSILEEDEIRTVEAIQKRNVDELSVVCINSFLFGDESEPQDYVYKLDLRDQGNTNYLSTPSEEFVFFPIGVSRYPDRDDFIILNGTEGEYFIIAGPKPFVEEALGKSVDEGRAEFQNWIDQEKSEKLKYHLQGIADRCAPFSGD